MDTNDGKESASYTRDANEVTLVKSSKRQGRLEKENVCMRIALIVFLVMLVVMFIICVFLYIRAKNFEEHRKIEEAKDANTCHKHQCITSAKNIYSNLDLSVDPCEHFYNYSCRGWIIHNPQPDEALDAFTVADQNQINLKDKIIDILEKSGFNYTSAMKKAQNFFSACTHKEFRNNAEYAYGISTLKNVLIKIGGFPLIDERWKSDGYHWENAYAYTDTRLNSLQFFFEYEIVEDTSTSKMIIEIRPPQAMHMESIIKNEASFREQIKSKLKILGSDLSNQEIDSKISDLIELIKKLAEVIGGSENIEQKSMTVSIATLAAEHENINWMQLFTRILESAEIRITNDETVRITSVSYFTKLDTLLKNSNKRTLANYIGWKVVSEFGSTIEFDSHENLTSHYWNNEENVQKLKQTCAEYTEHFFRVAISYTLIKSEYNQETFNELRHFLRRLKAAFTISIQNNELIAGHIKVKALKKLNNILEMVADPLSKRNDVELDRIYANTGVVSNENFANAYLQMSKWKKKLQILQLRNSTFSKTVSMIDDASDVANENKVYIISGYFLPPFYYTNAPLAVNFGAIGSAIGHQIGHELIDSVIDTEESYENKSKCFSKQYNQINQGSNINSKSKSTVEESIADLAGVLQTYMAYKLYALKQPEEDLSLPSPMNRFTKEQLFFISYANTLCVNQKSDAIDKRSPYSAEVRVMLPLMNSIEFANAFECKDGTKMNTNDKCGIW